MDSLKGDGARTGLFFGATSGVIMTPSYSFALDRFVGRQYLRLSYTLSCEQGIAYAWII